MGRKQGKGWEGFDRKLLVAGHRGARHLRPENTLTAFRYAIAQGVDMVETDVRMTKDGELVIMHDETVDRCTDGKGRVCDMTLAEFKKLNAAAEYGYFEAPPTFREFLELCSKEAPGMLIDFEFKEYPTEGREAWAYEACDKAIAMIEEFGYGDLCVINSFSGKLLEYIHMKYGGRYRLHGYYPFFQLGEMTMDPKEILYCVCMFNNIRTPEGKTKGFNDVICPKSWFDDVIAMGLVPWVGASVFADEDVKRAIEYGAELVTTDYPFEMLRSVALADKE